MSHLEIEFKTLLSLEEFKALRQQYFQHFDEISQKNIYIDTDNFDLRAHRMMLRIRCIDKSYMMTLKKQISHGVLEFDGTINTAQFINPMNDIPQNILEQLIQHAIDVAALRIQGELHTYRLEKKLHKGLLVLDKSEYSGITDYELEFEAHDYNEGRAFFADFLRDNNIVERSDIPKSERFYRTLYKEKAE